ncbi:serine hydrolase domain-containing protein [Nocardia sp. NPDC052566]|uniref:serine hydrolase domain-containing protein n=1 Tax=Nocardia sp. NPDC052566 TaxID=3364330 RepID=UPI0037C79A82
MNENSKDRMPRIVRRAGVTAAAAVTLLAGVACTTAEPKAAAAPDRPELQAAAQQIVDAGFAGVQVRVRDERGEWVGRAGVRELGKADKPPTDGKFWTGSSVKPFTATMVLQLVADGAIGLDAPVADYLPDLGLDRRITVRMMLQHRSGLFNYTGEYYADGTIAPGIPATGKEWFDNRFHSYRPEELVRLALSKPARFEPGTDWNYSNTNYTLALLLIEKVTGRSYAEQMQLRILGPLGMHDTVVPGPTLSQIPGPHAHGYFRYQDGDQWKTADVADQNLSLLPAAGDLISTTADLATFFSALNAGKLLPAPLLTEMRKADPKLSYGLGVFVMDMGPNCGTVLNHNGSPPAGYGTMMYSSSDGSKTLTASVTMGDAAIDAATAFPKSTQRLIDEVFCGGKSGGK